MFQRGEEVPIWKPSEPTTDLASRLLHLFSNFKTHKSFRVYINRYGNDKSKFLQRSHKFSGSLYVCGERHGRKSAIFEIWRTCQRKLLCCRHGSLINFACCKCDTLLDLCSLLAKIHFPVKTLLQPKENTINIIQNLF